MKIDHIGLISRFAFRHARWANDVCNIKKIIIQYVSWQKDVRFQRSRVAFSYGLPYHKYLHK